jgi:hypothetical protein
LYLLVLEIFGFAEQFTSKDLKEVYEKRHYMKLHLTQRGRAATKFCGQT